MREARCPICAGEVPGMLRRAKTFRCPKCNELLRVKRFGWLFIPPVACGYAMAYVAAERLGLNGMALLVSTLFLGLAAGFVLSCALGLILG